MYRALFERSSDAILIADVETKRFRYANSAASRLLGYAETELHTMGFADIHPTDAGELGKSEFERIARGESTRSADIPCLKKDGSLLYADIRSTAVTMDGRPMSAAFFHDLTEARGARKALEASEARYRRLFESAKDGIVIVDAHTGQIIDVNPFLTELTGYSRADFLGAHLWEIGLFKDIAASKALFSDLQVREYVRYEHLPLAARSGSKIDVEFVSNVYPVDGQKVIQCNIRDITARKRVEAERERLTMAIEQAAEVVLVADAKGDIVYVNPAFETVTGYSQAEARGFHLRALESVQDEAAYGAIWDTIGAGKTWRGRLVNKKKDGKLYTQEGTIAVVRDASGAVTSYVAVARDITQDLALEGQLRQAQKMEAIGRLAGSVAHDFNNVLSVILSYAQMIALEPKLDESLRADVDEIKKAALRASALTGQLLTFSRQQVLEAKVLNLDEIVIGMEKMLGRLLGADIELTILSKSDLWNVKADPGQMEQVLMNFAVNARDAMPEGGALTIQTANVDLDDDYARSHLGVRPGSYVKLAVSDSGTGMDRETQTMIFEPFFTTKEPGKGTGLGLATVFGIVQQSGGHISVSSDPGHGTTFNVLLPRASDAREVGSSNVDRPAPEPACGNETILVVEDDDPVRALARDILRRRGYVVLVASNGGEAFLICEQHKAHIHLLLTDLVLPRMSGLQLAERLAPMRPEIEGAHHVRIRERYQLARTCRAVWVCADSQAAHAGCTPAKGAGGIHPVGRAVVGDGPRDRSLVRYGAPTNVVTLWADSGAAKLPPVRGMAVPAVRFSLADVTHGTT